MKISIVPVTESSDAVLLNYGTGQTGLCGLDDEFVSLAQRFGAPATCDLNGIFADHAGESIDRYFRRLTNLPVSKGGGGHSHPDRLNKAYSSRARKAAPASSAPVLPPRLAGWAFVSGPTRVGDDALEIVETVCEIDFIPPARILQMQTDDNAPHLSITRTAEAAAETARILLEGDALILHLGRKHSARGEHSSALRDLLLRMAGLVARAGDISEGAHSDHERHRLARIVIVCGDVGAYLIERDIFSALWALPEDQLFANGMLPCLAAHSEVMQAAAVLAENIRTTREATEPPLVCVPLDFHGDLADGASLNRDPLDSDSGLLRRRDFADLSVHEGDPSNLWLKMLDAVREIWRPFNLTIPLLAAAHDFPSRHVFMLDASDWRKIVA